MKGKRSRVETKSLITLLPFKFGLVLTTVISGRHREFSVIEPTAHKVVGVS